MLHVATGCGMSCTNSSTRKLGLIVKAGTLAARGTISSGPPGLTGRASLAACIVLYCFQMAWSAGLATSNVCC